MANLTAAQLRSIAGPKAVATITNGVVAHLDLLDKSGISPPHRLAQFIAQIAHESDRFKTTTEYASGAAYEGRRDLGNTQRGDGRRFRGRGVIQLTGRGNVTRFNKWVHREFSHLNPPDFVAKPKMLAEFPWAILSAVWYWDAGNPTAVSLNRYADANNIEMITRRINGGLNGFDERLELYTRTALVLLGYKMISGVIARFQKDAGILVDDIDGPQTRASLHNALLKLDETAVMPPVHVPPAPSTPPPAIDDDWSPGGQPESSDTQPALSWWQRLLSWFR